MEIDFANLNLNNNYDMIIDIIMKENRSIIKLQESLGICNLLESIFEIKNGKVMNFDKVIKNLDIIIKDANKAIMYSLDEESESFFDDIKNAAINSKKYIDLFYKKS